MGVINEENYEENVNFLLQAWSGGAVREERKQEVERALEDVKRVLNQALDETASDNLKQ